MIRDGGRADGAIAVDAGRPDGALPPAPTPTPTPQPPTPPPPTDGGTFTCTVSGPVVGDLGPGCSSTTVDCILLCTEGDGACQQRCIESDPTPGMACLNCINSNFIACAQRLGCQDEWDTYVCCAEQFGCLALSGTAVDTCIAASCMRQQDGYSACDTMHGETCSSEVIAECFP